MTYAVARGGIQFVLRRPPRGPLPPSAHDVLREARVLKATAGHARVPEVLATCDDETVIGAPFYLMERVPGPRDHLDDPRRARRRGGPPPRRRGADRRARRDPRRALGGGRPRGLRQAAGLPRAPAAPLRRAVGPQQDARHPPGRARRRRGSGEHLPESGPATIVHGDYRLGNTMYAPAGPGALQRDLRLGDGDDRRPAGRPRLPVHAVGRPRRPARRHVRAHRASRARPASRGARS